MEAVVTQAFNRPQKESTIKLVAIQGLKDIRLFKKLEVVTTKGL
jgi:hypothetical protein